MEHASYQHTSVLTREIVEYIRPEAGGMYLDVTFGGGGHTRAILEHEPHCSVVAIDWDTNALEKNGPPLQEAFPGRLRLLWGNFGSLYKLIVHESIGPFNGIVADLGTSQFQIARMPGFSFFQDTPLDMRMSPSHQKLTAAELINKASEEKLRQIFWQLGQEPYAKQIVAAIGAKRKEKDITTTKQLAELVISVVLSRGQKIHPATRVFQALRIYINHELENLESLLPAAIESLVPGGRLAVISFHSLEDRIVKTFFRQAESSGKAAVVTLHAVRPGDQEIIRNPSARSARLRVIAKRLV